MRFDSSVLALGRSLEPRTLIVALEAHVARVNLPHVATRGAAGQTDVTRQLLRVSHRLDSVNLLLRFKLDLVRLGLMDLAARLPERRHINRI